VGHLGSGDCTRQRSWRNISYQTCGWRRQRLTN
jgi:hypothetical protein